MRIVSGKLKGRAIVTPDGRTTRPTSDRAREAMFNVLTHADWGVSMEGLRVMDLYAGSGALGLEAISRGAAHALFVETDTRARGIIRENIEKYALFGITRIHRRSATDLGPKPAGAGDRYDIAFMDPPYGYDLVGPTLAQLVKGNWLKPDALIVAETSKDEAVPEMDGYELMDSRDYGAARVLFLRRI
ncbi:MAG: 16S rRNA (guanine(966)-N(2))-methyltransferase RsmD [Hirschia sp.]|nr:16S rRNA (guanine(966)-N(2))-methyltransferase RsmD [Hirschia sp.]MBF18569.1 16S rRNA (guanine(966)-N(2))-methyltransferase RsmD [Hirschia sp.]